MRPPVCFLLIALGGPLGYLAGSALTPLPEDSAPDAAAVSGVAVTNSAVAKSAPAMITGSLEGSAMLVEWDRINAEGGGEFSKLFARIKETEDAFRRRAYRAAVLSDWVGRDPKNTLVFLRGKDKWMATQFVREWLQTNPNAAIDQLLSDGAASRNELGSLLEEIAKLAPGRLAEICAKNMAAVPANPQTSSSSSAALNPEKAFAVFAGQDLEAARAAAETLTGKMRDQAMAGIGASWAEKDGTAALAWAEKLPPGAARDTVLQRVLASWAKTDPFAALGKIDLLPKGNNNGNSQNNGVSQVLAEASKKDWYATIDWLKEHPERTGNNVVQGLQTAFARRLRDDPIPMMRDLMTGAVPALNEVFGSGISGEGYAQRDAIWTWLQGQPKNLTTEKLSLSLLNAVAYKEPAAAMELVRNFPNTEENRRYFDNVADSMFNGDNFSGKLEEWYDKAPAAMRPFLLENALNNNPSELGANAAKWVARLDELPAEMRDQAVNSLASGWANNNPKAAMKWALGLTNPQEQTNAFAAVASTWVYQDNEEFAQVLETMPKGIIRDRGTQALAQSVLASSPEAAWEWALEVQDENSRLDSLRNIYTTYAVKNREAADELLHGANLTEAQIQQFEQVREMRAAQRSRNVRQY